MVLEWLSVTLDVASILKVDGQIGHIMLECCIFIFFNCPYFFQCQLIRLNITL